MEINSNKNKRFKTLDLLRGSAIFFMIAAHAVYFFHNYTSSILINIEKFGNTIAFTTFLLVSAATAQIVYFSNEDFVIERKNHLLRRVATLACGYYILAFVIFSPNIISSHGFERLKLLFDILTLRNLASYGEFFIPFIFFPLIISALPKFFRKISKSFYLSVSLGIAIYLLGMFYYQLPIIDFFIPWKALFFGASGYYRFPIFQYFLLYLIGMAWGDRLLRSKTVVKKQIEITKAIFISSVMSFVLIFTGLFVTNRNLDLLAKRWPPSISFLLIGISFATLLALVFYKTKQLKRIPLLRDGLLVLGQNALGLTFVHILLAQLYLISGGIRIGSITLYIVGFISLLGLSIALAAILPLNFKLSLKLRHHQYHEDQLKTEVVVQFEEKIIEDIEAEAAKVKRFFFLGKYPGKKTETIKRRHLLAIALMLAGTAIIVFPPAVEEYYQKISSSKQADWYNSSFGWRERLYITNEESLAELPKNSYINLQFDHKKLVTEKKSYTNGKDLMFVFWDGNGYKDVNFWLKDANSTTTTITFKTQEKIKPGVSNTNYYLYYGNNLARGKSQTSQTPSTTTSKTSVIIKDEEAHPQLLTIDRRWSLISDDPRVAKDIRISLDTREDYSTNEVEYSVYDTMVRGTLTKTGEKHWEGTINTNKLKPGDYHLAAMINSGENNIETTETGFFVSYPLYIAWTLDWEGYDVSDSYLSAISQMSKEHGLRITHFWNPRATITNTIPQNRKDALLTWIKNRQTSFDENIQLHLHMFKDFVTASGVTPKYSPNWGDNGDGYGSLTTNYNTEEMTKIISKAVEIMRSSGLETPTIYRAGGWFASEETLTAVEASGLLADSSGRTSYKFYSQTGPWNLSATAQPYRPSKSDQDKPGNPAFDILEIPNNGADSYWFSTEEMKNRFTENYMGGTLTSPKQITYLSHPHWFNKTEQNKIETLFSFIDNYRYDNDSGPAIYVTSEEIYEVWSKL